MHHPGFRSCFDVLRLLLLGPFLRRVLGPLGVPPSQVFAHILEAFFELELLYLELQSLHLFLKRYRGDPGGRMETEDEVELDGYPAK